MPFIDKAFGEMLAIATALGDERINRRPDLPGSNSPYVIITHCVGVTSHWLGTVVARRRNTRNRPSEFRAVGTIAQLHMAVAAALEQCHKDILLVGNKALGDLTEAAGVGSLPTLGPGQQHTESDVLLLVYTELAQHLGQLELTRDTLLAE